MNINELMRNAEEKPLDSLVSDGGFCGIFRTIGCVGDSLSSGEFEAIDEKGVKSYHDMMEYSWGQYMARMTGSTVYNFSKGGMTAKEYCDSFAEKNGFWDRDKACQAYIIALGVNDLLNKNMPLGSHNLDVDYGDYRKNNLETFAGYYGMIIARLKEISPEAKFFLMTMPRQEGESTDLAQKREAHAALLHHFTERFSNCYLLDFWKYAPVYDREFHEQFFLGGHMNPCGYLLTAKMVASYIDYIIRHNMRDFREVAFIGTGLSYRRM